jgi:hypothetical protein
MNGDLLRLGDIDGGVALDVVLSDYMHDFEYVSPDKTTSIHCSKTHIQGEEMFFVLDQSETGIEGEIIDSSGVVRFCLSPDDTQRVKYGALLQLPRLDVTGYLATEVKNGRSVIEFLKKGIQQKFRIDFPRLLLEIFPYVPGQVFRRVMEEDGFKTTKFIRYQRPADRAVAAVQKWGTGNVIGKLGPRSTMFGRLARTAARPSSKDENSAYGVIVEIHDGTVESSVVMELTDGTRRSFRLHQSGPAFTEEMICPPAEKGVPTEASLLATLRDALRDVRN